MLFNGILASLIMLYIARMDKKQRHINEQTDRQRGRDIIRELQRIKPLGFMGVWQRGKNLSDIGYRELERFWFPDPRYWLINFR